MAEPLAIGGSHCSFCSSLPYSQMGNMASEPCTDAALRSPESAASSSRQATPYAIGPVPAHPYPVRCMPNRPSFPSSVRTDRGRMPASNQSPTLGITWSVTKARTVSRMSRSSSPSWSSMRSRSVSVVMAAPISLIIIRVLTGEFLMTAPRPSGHDHRYERTQRQREQAAAPDPARSARRRGLYRARRVLRGGHEPRPARVRGAHGLLRTRHPAVPDRLGDPSRRGRGRLDPGVVHQQAPGITKRCSERKVANPRRPIAVDSGDHHGACALGNQILLNVADGEAFPRRYGLVETRVVVPSPAEDLDSRGMTR